MLTPWARWCEAPKTTNAASHNFVTLYTLSHSCGRVHVPRPRSYTRWERNGHFHAPHAHTTHLPFTECDYTKLPILLQLHPGTSNSRFLAAIARDSVLKLWRNDLDLASWTCTYCSGPNWTKLSCTVTCLCSTPPRTTAGCVCLSKSLEWNAMLTTPFG